MSARRITRKEMKRDEFVSTVGRISLWMEEHMQTVLLGVGAAILLFVALILVGRFMAQREEKASALLARGIQIAQTPIRTADATAPSSPFSYESEREKYQATLDQMEAVLQTYPRSRAARLALYYKGMALLSLGQSDQAVETLEFFLSEHPGNYFAPMAQAVLARALEASGELEKALGVYQKLSEAEDGVYPPQAALMEMGLCLERMGREGEARQVYERITREHPGSEYSRQADQRLKDLS